MKNLLKHKSGFTMVELMVVVIIVAILAAVAIPLYTANIKRAIRTEAEATLGSIRSAERIYKSEYNTYAAAAAAGNGTAQNGDVYTVLGVDISDPHYFDNRCYTVTASGTGTTATFLATCKSDASNAAPSAVQAQKYFATGTTVETMDQGGTVTTP